MVNYAHQRSWTQNADNWKAYRPPLRPSSGEMKIIEKFIADPQTVKLNWQLKALILGATPEYRDLLARHKIKTVIVDYNENSVRSMNRLLKFRGLKKEKVIINNWQKMKFAANNFDVVLADWSFNNLQKISDYPKLLFIIRKILKPGGIFINRMNVYDVNVKIRTVKQIMQNYQQNSKEKYSYLQEMQDYSFSSARNKKTFISDLEKFYHYNLPLAFQRGEMTRAQFGEFTGKITHGRWRIKLKLTIPNKAEFERLLRRCFKIVAFFYGKDYLYSRHIPIYLTRPIK